MIRIFNNTDLSYEDLGYFIDRLREKETTMYVGQKNNYKFEIRGKKYLIKTKQLLRDFKIEVNKYGL